MVWLPRASAFKSITRSCAWQAQRDASIIGDPWWLNTKQKQWPSGPAASFAAVGNGGNIVWIDPEHDIVLVWHWHEPGKAVDGMIQRIMAAVTGG